MQKPQHGFELRLFSAGLQSSSCGELHSLFERDCRLITVENPLQLVVHTVPRDRDAPVHVLFLTNGLFNHRKEHAEYRVCMACRIVNTITYLLIQFLVYIT